MSPAPHPVPHTSPASHLAPFTSLAPSPCCPPGRIAASSRVIAQYLIGVPIVGHGYHHSQYRAKYLSRYFLLPYLLRNICCHICLILQYCLLILVKVLPASFKPLFFYGPFPASRRSFIPGTMNSPVAMFYRSLDTTLTVENWDWNNSSWKHWPEYHERAGIIIMTQSVFNALNFIRMFEIITSSKGIAELGYPVLSEITDDNPFNLLHAISVSTLIISVNISKW